jgi:hypothetical protein
MGLAHLDSILGSYSVPGIDFYPIIPAQVIATYLWGFNSVYFLFVEVYLVPLCTLTRYCIVLNLVLNLPKICITRGSEYTL